MPQFSEILIRKFDVSPEKIETAVKTILDKGNGSLAEILLAQRVVNEETLAQALAMAYHLPYLKEIPQNIPAEIIKQLPISYAQTNMALPYKIENGVVSVAIGDPFRAGALEDLRVIYGCRVEASVVNRTKLSEAINLSYAAAKDVGEQLGGEALDKFEDDSSEFTDIADLVMDDPSDEPIIKFVNNLLFRAVKEHASDVHIEPMERDVVVRNRIDGVLYEVTRVPKAAQARVTSRVKIMGNLNIAEKRLPQDGRIRIKIAGRDIDIRLSTLPTSHGERIVMRLLDRSSVLLELTDMGFSQRNFQLFSHLINQPHGIILVTGPTGSGKTTTLYGALSKMNTEDVNIITIEDPVEYQLPGIGQIHVNSKINLTFASGLRSILRQDPDIIMVGEIRDFETAEIAVQASLTGHLVLSTVHTNDAPSSITRLVDMGVEPFLVGSSIIGILAQRLVRKLCRHCRVPFKPSPEVFREMGVNPVRIIGSEPDVIYKASDVGCQHCNGRGYSGRSAIFELLIVDDDIRQAILRNENSTVLKKKAMDNGMLSLREDGARKVFVGETSIEEVLRVTQDEAVVEW